MPAGNPPGRRSWNRVPNADKVIPRQNANWQSTFDPQGHMVAADNEVLQQALALELIAY